MKSRAIIPLIVGLAVGGVAIKGFLNVLRKAKGANNADTVEIVRAAADIAPTVEITEAMVSKASAPRALLPDGAFTDVSKVVGRVTSQMIPKGMPVAPSLLAPEGTPPGMAAKIQDGYRAVAIQIDEIIGVGGWIKPGTRVDVVMVMAGTGGSKSRSISKVILQNVEVLAVGNKTEAGGQNATVTRSVTVLVKPEEASKLHLASSKGKLQLAMRSQEDHREPKPVIVTDEDLLADGASGRNRQHGDASLLARLFGPNLPKADPRRDDTKGAEGEVREQTQQKEWVVEVLSGSEAYKVKFDGNGKVGEQIPLSVGQPGHSSKAPGGPARFIAPLGDTRGNATDSKAAGSGASDSTGSADRSSVSSEAKAGE